MDERDGEIAQRCHHLWCLACPQARAIFPEGHIAHLMEAIFNGIITNDKFCMSRVSQLHRISARPMRSGGVAYALEENIREGFPQEEPYETTAMDPSTVQHRDERRPVSLGSSLSISGPMECSRKKRTIHQSFHPGEQR
jgi:hypothetical protein